MAKKAVFRTRSPHHIDIPRSQRHLFKITGDGGRKVFSFLEGPGGFFRLQGREHQDDPRQKPKGFHDPHDDESIRAQGMHAEPHETRHETVDKAPVERGPDRFVNLVLSLRRVVKRATKAVRPMNLLRTPVEKRDCLIAEIQDIIKKNGKGGMMKYKVTIQKTEEGYSVCVPGLPGCWSQGDTEEEALENIKDAIEGYLETIEELIKEKESRYVEVG